MSTSPSRRWALMMGPVSRTPPKRWTAWKSARFTHYLPTEWPDEIAEFFDNTERPRKRYEPFDMDTFTFDPVLGHVVRSLLLGAPYQQDDSERDVYSKTRFLVLGVSCMGRGTSTALQCSGMVSETVG